MMQQPDPPPPHVSPTGMWISKLALRIIQLALAITIMGCTGTLYNSLFFSATMLIVIIPQAAVSAIWSLSEGICILARPGRRGIHPGANVALDLLLWLGLVVGAVLLGLLGVGSRGTRVSLSYYGSGTYTREDIARVGEMGQALIGLAATLTILHFTTFVIACVETNKRDSAGDVVFVTTTHYAYGPPYGYNAQPVVYVPAPPAQAHHNLHVHTQLHHNHMTMT